MLDAEVQRPVPASFLQCKECTGAVRPLSKISSINPSWQSMLYWSG
ncbi:hypothetical protein RISK_000031 [Rhodopirellula islandica]|uniref:Uncharacterized protein n=1 Tax=Rhodopirellula islandica TaxID=595434 RepID=A0A0J1BMX7_RHOIS|nr:hypothetical protein RISK_000031 [Rhodopirellula islandica]